jgi:hypothetical protein
VGIVMINKRLAFAVHFVVRKSRVSCEMLCVPVARKVDSFRATEVTAFRDKFTLVIVNTRWFKYDRDKV